MGKILEIKAVEVVEDAESELKVDDELERSCCWVSVTASRDFLMAHRSWRDLYCDPCKSSSWDYHETSAIIGS